MKYPKVKLIKTTLLENNFVDKYKGVWNSTKLIEQSKKYKSFDMPLCGIDLSRMPWSMPSVVSFIDHMYRCENSDLKYPVILDDEGCIADGWHRIAKAILLGKETIKTIRLEEMPAKDRTEN